MSVIVGVKLATPDLLATKPNGFWAFFPVNDLCAIIFLVVSEGLSMDFLGFPGIFFIKLLDLFKVFLPFPMVSQGFSYKIARKSPQGSQP